MFAGMVVKEMKTDKDASMNPLTQRHYHSLQ